jgi:hypothetical protein
MLTLLSTIDFVWWPLCSDPIVPWIYHGIGARMTGDRPTESAFRNERFGSSSPPSNLDITTSFLGE